MAASRPHILVRQVPGLGWEWVYNTASGASVFRSNRLYDKKAKAGRAAVTVRKDYLKFSTVEIRYT